MITFDKLKIVTDIEDLTIVDESAFRKVIDKGIVSTLIYHSEKIYLLNVKVDYLNKEAVIEFTGKILGKEYPKLISIDTIRQCIGNINALGFCVVNVEAILEHGQVVSCDVTKDVRCEDVPKFCSFVRAHISNYNQFKCTLLRNGNLTIEKNVTSTKFKKRMVVYDKAREMAKAVNREFVESSGLEGEFDGMCRFEINLNSKEQIRSALGITDNRLISVLTSSANPIGDFVKQVVTFDSGSTICDSLKTEMRLLLLKDCDYDLAKVEARIRAYDKHGNIKQNLAPFRALYESVCAQENAGMVIDVIDRLA